jgi:hypothetical protein
MKNEAYGGRIASSRSTGHFGRSRRLSLRDLMTAQQAVP